MPVIDPAKYVRVPGPKRRYFDLTLQREVSRSAAIQGSTGFSVHKRVAANKAANPEASAARPARGRQKAGYAPSSTSRLRPLQGKIARRVGAGRTAASYDRALAGLKRNSQVFSVAALAVFTDTSGHEKFVWLQDATLPDQVMSGAEAVAAVGIEDERDVGETQEDEEIDFSEPDGLLQNLTYADFKFSNFAFHVHFDRSAYRPKPKAKREGKVRVAYTDDNGVRVVKYRKRKKPGRKPGKKPK